MPIEVVVVLTLVFGFFIQSVFGFAGGLVSVPILSYFIGVKDSVTLILIFQVLLGLIVVKTYKEINWSLALKMLVASVIGVPLGTFLLGSLDPRHLAVLLSLSIFLIVPLIGTKDTFLHRFSERKFAPYIFGLIFGAMNSLFGVAGPIAVIFLSVQTKNKEVFRATNLFVLSTTNIARLFISLQSGFVTGEIIRFAAIAFPFFLASMFLGDKFSRSGISDETFYRWVKVILCVSAGSILYKAL